MYKSTYPVLKVHRINFVCSDRQFGYQQLAFGAGSEIWEARTLRRRNHIARES